MNARAYGFLLRGWMWLSAIVGTLHRAWLKRQARVDGWFSARQPGPWIEVDEDDNPEIDPDWSLDDDEVASIRRLTRWRKSYLTGAEAEVIREREALAAEMRELDRNDAFSRSFMEVLLQDLRHCTARCRAILQNHVGEW